MNGAFTLHGYKILESHHLLEDGQPQTVRRTWRERLFSRPWRPWRATRTFVPRVPYRGAFRVGSDTVLMHPAMVIELRKASQIRTVWQP